MSISINNPTTEKLLLILDYKPDIVLVLSDKSVIDSLLSNCKFFKSLCNDILWLSLEQRELYILKFDETKIARVHTDISNISLDDSHLWSITNSNEQIIPNCKLIYQENRFINK